MNYMGITLNHKWNSCESPINDLLITLHYLKITCEFLNDLWIIWNYLGIMWELPWATYELIANYLIAYELLVGYF